MNVPSPRKDNISDTKTLAILILSFVLRGWKIVIVLYILNVLLCFLFSQLASSDLNILPLNAMMKLIGINYQKWKKILVMNLTFMKLDLALEIDPTRDID